MSQDVEDWAWFCSVHTDQNRGPDGSFWCGSVSHQWQSRKKTRNWYQERVCPVVHPYVKYNLLRIRRRAKKNILPAISTHWSLAFPSVEEEVDVQCSVAAWAPWLGNGGNMCGLRARARCVHQWGLHVGIRCWRFILWGVWHLEVQIFALINRRWNRNVLAGPAWGHICVKDVSLESIDALNGNEKDIYLFKFGSTCNWLLI